MTSPGQTHPVASNPSSRPINILYVIDYFHRTGGTERHLVHLLRNLPRESFKCSVVVFDLGPGSLLEEVREQGIPIVHLPVGREYTPNALLRARQLYRLIRAQRIDVVQTFHQKSDTYGAIIARLAGVRHIISSKRDTGNLRRPWHFFLNRRLRFLFERIIVVADAVADAVVKSDHLDRSLLVKIYNGVDATAFSPASPAAAKAARERFGFEPDDFAVGMVAGFRPEKNHEMFFEGALAAAAAIPGLRILAVGGGPLLEEFRRRYAGREAVIRFAGDVKDVAQVLHAMDVGCLLPSMNEGFSNAVVEKMATGLPVIVTDVGGNAEAVRHGENGYVLQPLDVQGFTQALIDMYADPARRLAMGRRSRQLVEECFSLQQMCQRHEALYRELCAPDVAV